MPQVASIASKDLKWFYTFGVLALLAVLTGFYFNQKILLVLPFTIFVALWAILNFKTLFFTLWALVPLSIEFDVSESLATDLPTEPFMAGFLLLSLFYLLQKAPKIDFSFFKNPLILLLILHIVWINIAGIFSTVPLFSLKFILAKFWYISAFFIVTSLVIQSKEDVLTLIWCILLPMLFTVVVALYRHALTGFDFTAINPVLRPFYRNHVNYAAILSVFLPFVFYARTHYTKFSFKYNFLMLSVLLLLVGIYFSYTRASYLAIIALFLAYAVFRLKLTKYLAVLALLGVFFVAKFLVFENHYLKYTPSTNTVSQHELGDLIDATFKAEDVSSMERIYRWIAAIHMIGEKPIVGFGPNGFVENYKNYTVFVFETWISDNEERSGVHNYFLMTAVEQGLVGLAIFLGLLLAFFLWGEKVYHQQTGAQQLLAMAVLLSMTALLVNLFFSDMIEVDKTGSFFFLNIALMVLLSRNFKGLISKT